MPAAVHRSSTLGTVRGVAVALIGIGTAAHLSRLLELVVATTTSPLHALPGELTAPGQPHRQVFLAAAWIAGVAFVLAGPPLLRLVPVHWQARLTVSAVVTFGVLLLLRAALPLDCAVSVTESCSATARSGTHTLHRVVSGTLMVYYVLGPATLALWWRGGWRAVPLAAIAGEVVGWAAAFAFGDRSGPLLGLATRSQLLAGIVMFSAGIAYLLTVGRQPRVSGDGIDGAGEARVPACQE
jgi:hypothetical protein